MTEATAMASSSRLGLLYVRGPRSIELTPFLGFVHVWPTQELHVFQWADCKDDRRTVFRFMLCN